MSDSRKKLITDTGGEPRPPVRLYVSDKPASDRQDQSAEIAAKQRKHDTLQSLVSASILVILCVVVLGLVAVLPLMRETNVLVSYQAPRPPEEKPMTSQQVAPALRPKPPGSSSSMAKAIAATVESPVSIPVPDNPKPSGLIGVAEDFGQGFGVGAGDGDGGGGGGARFFGMPRRGRRVVFVVDFSESMRSNSPKGGGTLLDDLKKELDKSISGLRPSMNFNVIFFSHQAWTIDTPGGKEAPDNGWNGLKEPPPISWYPATDQVKQVFKDKMQNAPTGWGTVWYSPLKWAFSMSPPPDIVYLLSDGEPSDFEETMDRLSEMNPNKVPIDTIAFEAVGREARFMYEVAKATGGNFVLVHKGRMNTGIAAQRLTDSKYDEK